MKREEFVKGELVGVISLEWPCSFCHGGIWILRNISSIRFGRGERIFERIWK